MTIMTRTFGAGLLLALAGSSYLAMAQQPPAAPPQPMSFFITSAGSGKGADLGGIAGADRICQTLATAAGSTKTWHAYLSAPAANGQPAVNARDRIGVGPWYNAKGARIAQNVADLHGDTLEAARRGNNLGKQTAITRARTGRAARRAPRNSVIPIATAAATRRGTRHIRAAAAARTTSSAPA